MAEEQPPPNTKPLITASSYFLSLRNFSDAKSYALRAQSSDPSHPDPPRLLSILSVLSTPKISPTLPDHYSILNLTRFLSDPTRIRSSFTSLTSILNPNTNTHPLSSEAYDLVLKAWSVLSNPVEKARFDEELRRIGGGGASSTFWTMCPYCYHVYEYDRVYEECCLRCSNGKCRRAFQSVEIVGGSPPVEVVEEGYYRCSGLVLVEDDVGSWVPYMPKGPEAKEEVEEDGCKGDGFIIDISDEEKGGGRKRNVEGGPVNGNGGSGGGEVEFDDGEEDVL